MGKTKKEDIIVDVTTAEEKLGQELIAEIAEKEWKTAPLPTEEDLAREKKKNPKARSNINSRQNLIQYRTDKPQEVKEEIVKGLQFKNKRIDVDPFKHIILPEGYDKNKVIPFLPDRRVMKDAEEEELFYTVLNSFLNDFDLGELSSSDMEDVVSLAVNRILENRLLGLSASDPNTLMDVSATIEKFRRHSEKIKGNLVSRRADRVDPRNKQSYSIVDIVHSYDESKRREFKERMDRLNSEIEDFTNKNSDVT